MGEKEKKENGWVINEDWLEVKAAIDRGGTGSWTSLKEGGGGWEREEVDERKGERERKEIVNEEWMEMNEAIVVKKWMRRKREREKGTPIMEEEICQREGQSED